MDKVALDDMGRTVRFAVPGVELNFGAVGKGWALDRIVASLRVRGVSRALLTAGGSSHRGWGGESWELALRPGGEELGLLRLRDAALATSASGEQHFEADGRRFGHVLDPRTGWPAEGVRSASVVTSEAAVADALSTAFLVGGTVARRLRSAPRGRARWRSSSSTRRRARSVSSGSATASRWTPRPASVVVEATA